MKSGLTLECHSSWQDNLPTNVLSRESSQAPAYVSKMITLSGGVTRTVFIVLELDGKRSETRINGGALRGTPGFILMRYISVKTGVNKREL